MAYHLAKEGYRVSTAKDGTEALKTAIDERPDLIVLDLMLPGRLGFEVLEELRDRKETRHIGIIRLTARNERGDRLEGLELGADDYLGKPFFPEELVLRVAAILRRLQAPSVGLGDLRPCQKLRGDFIKISQLPLTRSPRLD